MKSSRLLEVDYSREDGMVIHLRPGAIRILPKESVQHWRSANKEMLLAFRSILDSVIERVGPEDESREQGRSNKRVVVTEETAP